MTDQLGQRLPAGWAVRTLREVGTWRGGGTPSKETPEYWTVGTIPWVSPKDMKTDVLSGAHDHITDEAVADSATSVVPAGSVLLVVRSGILKHTLPVAVAQRDLAINQDLKAVTPAPWIDSVYLAYALRAFAQDILNTCTKAGTTVQNVNFTALLDYRVPVAPPSEQRRIVEEIEKQLTRLDAGVAALRRVQANLKRYRAAVLKAACEGRLVPTEAELGRRGGRGWESGHDLITRILVDQEAECHTATAKKRKPRAHLRPMAPPPPARPLPAGWCWTGIEQLARGTPNAIKTGPFGSALKKSSYVPAGFKVYGQEQVIRGDAVYGDYFIDHDLYEKLRAYRVAPGDVLLSLVGTAGRVLVLNDGAKAGIINPRLIKLSLHPTGVDRDYLKVVLASPATQAFLKDMAHGQTMDVLNLTVLRALPIPLPPLAEQQRIVAEVERRLSLADALGCVVSANLHRATRLRRAILAWAFRGGLVPTGAELAREATAQTASHEGQGVEAGVGDHEG